MTRRWRFGVREGHLEPEPEIEPDPEHEIEPDPEPEFEPGFETNPNRTVGIFIQLDGVETYATPFEFSVNRTAVKPS